MRDLSNPGIPVVSVRGKMMEKEYSCEGPLNRGNKSLPSPDIYYSTNCQPPVALFKALLPLPGGFLLDPLPVTSLSAFFPFDAT